jgi:pyrroloquinoline quinone biosynthesis protein A
VTGHGDDGVRRNFLFLMVLRIYTMPSPAHHSSIRNLRNLTRRSIMWTKPAATEMRFGFEVTMYVMNK